MDDKKKVEIANVVEFLRRTSRDVLGPVVARETPDFEFRLAKGKLVGLELTELADPTIAKGESAISSLTAELRKRLLAEQLLVSLRLSVPEGCGALLAPRAVRRENVRALVELVRNHLVQKRAATTYTEGTLEALGIRFVPTVTIQDGNYVGAGHSARGRGASFVQSCIDAKNAKVGSYRSGLSGAELWLLVISGARFRSGIWSAVLEGAEFTTAFDRVFCLDKFEGRALELSIRRG